MNSKKQAPTATNGKQEPMTKQKAAKRVFQKHGMDLSPPEIIRLVKQEFGLDLTTAHASNLKSTLKKEVLGESSTGNGKGKGKKKGKRSAKAVAKSQPQLAAAQTSHPKNQGLVSVDEISAVKELVERLGAKEMKNLID